MKDRLGKLRGGCKKEGCDCPEYVLPATGNDCDYCGCKPVQHIALAVTEASASTTQIPIATTTATLPISPSPTPEQPTSLTPSADLSSSYDSSSSSTPLRGPPSRPPPQAPIERCASAAKVYLNATGEVVATPPSSPGPDRDRQLSLSISTPALMNHTVKSLQPRNPPERTSSGTLYKPKSPTSTSVSKLFNGSSSTEEDDGELSLEEMLKQMSEEAPSRKKGSDIAGLKKSGEKQKKKDDSKRKTWGTKIMSAISGDKTKGIADKKTRSGSFLPGSSPKLNRSAPSSSEEDEDDGGSGMDFLSFLQTTAPEARPNTQQRISHPVLFEFGEAEDKQLLALLANVTEDAEPSTSSTSTRRLTSSDLRRNTASSLPKEIIITEEEVQFNDLITDYLLDLFKNNEENTICADCNQVLSLRESMVVAATLGLFICKGCGEIHEEVLGNNFILYNINSPDKSFSSSRQQELRMCLPTINNKLSNDMWENNIQGHTKPTPTTTTEEKTTWIRDKYERRLFTPLKEGIVVFQVGSDNWLHHYLTLGTKQLDIYAVDESDKPMKASSTEFIDLLSCSVHFLESELMTTFEIRSPARNYIFYLNNARDVFEWVNCIKGATSRLKGQDIVEKEIAPAVLAEIQEEEVDLIMAPDGSVKAGTVAKLVEMLTSEEYLDTEYMVAFLLTYRSFTTPTDLMELVCNRFSVVPPSDWSQEKQEDFIRKNQKQIRLRVHNVFKHWIANHFQDFAADNKLVYRLISFIDKTLDPAGMKGPADQLRKLLRKKIVGAKASCHLIIDNHKIPAPILPKNLTPGEFDFMDLDPLEVARQIALIEQSLYKSIQPMECLNQSWNKEGKETAAPNILATIRRFNAFSRFITTQVVKESKLKSRTKVLERCIILATKCRELNNFNSLMEIIAGLEETSVHRMTKTWEGLNGRLRQQYESLRSLMAIRSNYASFRTTLHNENPPCIPYIGVYLTDLTFIEDGIPDKINKTLIHFAKRRKISVVIREIQQYQQTPYPYQLVPNILTFLEEISWLEAEECFKLSLTHEPRQPKK